MHRTAILFLVAVFLLGSTGSAEYARPVYPDQHPGPLEGPAADIVRPDNPPNSTLRLQIGPAARFSETRPEGGLSTALEVGSGAAGVRFSGSWLRAGGTASLAQYSAELWLDLSQATPWRPSIGAGAGLAQTTERLSEGEVTRQSIGVALVRGGIQYALPVPNTDARAALDVTGVLPAFGDVSESSGDVWAVVAATVVVGF